jgi:hypothetical protein
MMWINSLPHSYAQNKSKIQHGPSAGLDSLLVLNRLLSFFRYAPSISNGVRLHCCGCRCWQAERPSSVHYPQEEQRSGDPLTRRRRSSVRNRRTSPSIKKSKKKKCFLALLKKNIGVSRRQPHKVSTLQVASKKEGQVKSIPREIQGRCQKAKQSKQACK